MSSFAKLFEDGALATPLDHPLDALGRRAAVPRCRAAAAVELIPFDHGDEVGTVGESRLDSSGQRRFAGATASVDPHEHGTIVRRDHRAQPGQQVVGSHVRYQGIDWPPLTRKIEPVAYLDASLMR